MNAFVRRKKTTAAALALSLVLCALAGTIGERTGASALPDGSTQNTRVRYLQSIGWEVTGDETAETATLPERFDGVYADYQKLQQSCGFDLTPYAGETVTRYSYLITNYPEASGEVRGDLLVWKGQIIGGDVRTTALDGFMSSLQYPEGSS